jgi:hypothetical protein
MDNQTLDYRMAETYQAAPLPLEECGIIKMQLRTDKGATRWLNITPEEYRAIERVLAGQRG